MMNALWVRDVAAFSAQIAALVLAGAGVAVVCRLRQPRAMLTFWRVLLFACLALPLCQPWHVPQAAVAFDGREVLEATTTAVSNAPAVSVPTGRSMSLVDLLFVVMLAGTAIQASWLAVGAIGLRRLRRGASPLSPLPEGIREAQVRLGTRSEILVSERASGPMTFGFFRPVVVLPSDVAEMPPHVQQAMAYHELIHVRRRDWISELFEEGVRAILWFHPAVWWLIGRIRLSREQVVDEAVIRITQSREHYIDALLVVALRKSPFTLAPAPTFLRRSLLKRRVAQIMQETTMTTYRLIASLTTSAVAVAVAAVFAVRSFPLQAQAPAPAQPGAGDPVQIVKGGENLMHGNPPEYPGRALKQQVEGDVVLDVLVDDRGEVADARVLTGPDEFRRVALESVLQWHYVPTAVSNRSIQVVFRFHPPALETAETEGGRLPGWVPEGRDVLFMKDGRTFKVRGNGEGFEEQSNELSASQKEHMMKEMAAALESLETPSSEKEELKRRLATMREEFAEQRIGFAREEANTGNSQVRLARVKVERFPDAMVQQILSKAGVSVGDIVSKESLERIRNIAAEADEHIEVEVGHDKGGDAVLVFITR
jgi:bla regulator protein blaR1